MNQRSPRRDRVDQVIIHIAEGYYEGTISWQKNPAADVSSHFIFGKLDGQACQMVDTDNEAWTESAGNPQSIGIENAGFSGDLLTQWQLNKCAQVLAKAHAVYGVPLQLMTSPSGSGLGWHSLGGSAWGGHPDCPGSPIIGQLPQIIALAKGEIDMGRQITSANIQQALKDAGYVIVVDDDWGPQSQSVLTAAFKDAKTLTPGPAGKDGKDGKDGLTPKTVTLSQTAEVTAWEGD